MARWVECRDGVGASPIAPPRARSRSGETPVTAPGEEQEGDPRVAPGASVTHRRVFALAVPMMLAHATTPLLGLVGTAAVGRLGDASLLGGIALGAVVFDVLFWTFGALRMATAGLTAQAVGAADPGEADRVLARALGLGMVIGVVLLVLQKPIGAASLTLAGASPAATAALATYFGLRIFAAPFTFANYAILGSTLGRGRTDLGLLLQVAINGLNIVLTIALVLGFRLGVAGAALACVLAEAAGVGFGAVVLARLGSRPFGTGGRIFEPAALRRMLGVNRDVMIRTAALVLALALFTAVGARAGDVVLAANAVLQNAVLVGSYVLDGFATAAETLCGQAYGAGRVRDFRRAARLSLLWSCGFGLAIAAAFLAFGPWFIDALSTNGAVREEARKVLTLASLSPLAGAAAFAFDGIYVGATWTRAMRDIMLACLGLYLVLLLGVGRLGNVGLWLAFLAFLAARGLGQAWAYPRLARGRFTSASEGLARDGMTRSRARAVAQSSANPPKV